MKQIFLISGKAQHGKDSTANILKKKLSGKTLILHNADFLKMIAEKYLGWDGSKNSQSRDLLQWLGTDRTRLELNKPLFWVEKVCDAIEIVLDKYDFFCVPDVRFENEVYLPKARFPGFITTIKIIRNNFDNGLSQKQKNHLSETSLDNFNFDYVIESESGLDKLEIEIDKFLQNMNMKEENNIDE